MQAERGKMTYVVIRIGNGSQLTQECVIRSVDKSTKCSDGCYPRYLSPLEGGDVEAMIEG